jgi:putative PIN family toxin of toxin-antitoxin system
MLLERLREHLVYCWRDLKFASIGCLSPWQRHYLLDTSHGMSYLILMRIVIDTSVLVAGLRSRNGASNALLVLVAERRITPLATVTLFLEYEDVLKRPEQRLALGLSLDDVDRLLASLAGMIEPVETYFRWRPQLRDADDDMVLEAAVNSGAEAIVTHNVADFDDVAPRFGMPILRPADVLRRMRS